MILNQGRQRHCNGSKLVVANDKSSIPICFRKRMLSKEKSFLLALCQKLFLKTQLVTMIVIMLALMMLMITMINKENALKRGGWHSAKKKHCDGDDDDDVNDDHDDDHDHDTKMTKRML